MAQVGLNPLNASSRRWTSCVYMRDDTSTYNLSLIFRKRLFSEAVGLRANVMMDID